MVIFTQQTHTCGVGDLVLCDNLGRHVPDRHGELAHGSVVLRAAEQLLVVVAHLTVQDPML